MTVTPEPAIQTPSSSTLAQLLPQLAAVVVGVIVAVGVIVLLALGKIDSNTGFGLLGVLTGHGLAVGAGATRSGGLGS